MKTSVMVKGIISKNLISQTHSKDCTIECTKHEGNCNEQYSLRLPRNVERERCLINGKAGRPGIHRHPPNDACNEGGHPPPSTSSFTLHTLHGVAKNSSLAISRGWQMEHGTNVVVVSIQSNSSYRILLFADWLFTTTTFVRCFICHSLVIL